MKTCNKCNAQNTDDAKFCCQCGAAFEDNDNIKEQAAPQPDENETVQLTAAQTDSQTEEKGCAEGGTEEQGGSDYKFESQFDSQIDLNSVNEAEFSVFVGKNQNDFIPAFRKFCSSKKVSFSPLVFLLSWLISPIAGAFWFFHRKMNKIGAIVLSIALALNIVGGVTAVFMVSDITDATETFVRENMSGSYSISPNAKYDYGADADDYFDDYFDDDDQYYDYYYGYDEGYDDYDYNSDDLVGEEEYARAIVETTAKYLPIMFLISLMNFAFALILGLFAKYWYFNYAAGSILAIKKNNPTPACINDISVAGGTKCTVWVICLVVCVLALIFFAFAMLGTVVNMVLNI